jgi:DNA polymerase-4
VECDPQRTALAAARPARLNPEICAMGVQGHAAHRDAATARVIAHLDMDAFYASVELLRHPELRGLPVVIGGGRRPPPASDAGDTRRFAKLADYAGRGVITTATYAARAFGVHSGMGLMKAAALCPQAVLLPVDFEEYRRHSRLFKAAVADIAPVIEDRGIDEIYIDLSDLPGAQDDHGRAIAQRIRTRVREATGLTCSIGLSPNKLLSKICSDLNKPDGLTVVTWADIPGVIWPLPARRINGIGPKAAERLESLGIHSIGELAAAPLLWLMEHFGRSYGRWLHDAAHGRDDRPVITHHDPKSFSRETTFERDLHPRHDREALGVIFTRLCEQLAADLDRKGFVGRTVGVKLRYDDFHTVTRDRSIDHHTADAKEIRRVAGECLKRVPLDQRLRLLGVRMGSVVRRDIAVHTGMSGHAMAVQESLPLFRETADAR